MLRVHGALILWEVPPKNHGFKKVLVGEIEIASGYGISIINYINILYDIYDRYKLYIYLLYDIYDIYILDNYSEGL
jgi:hypothetical protein